MKFYNLKQIYRETDEIEIVLLLACILAFSGVSIYFQSIQHILFLFIILFFSYFSLNYRATKNENKINESHSIIKILKNNPSFLKHDEDIQKSIFKLVSSNNINEQNEEGDTLLLYIAKNNKHSPYIGMLLLMGADPHILNNKNESAIKYIGEEYQKYIVAHEQKILTSTFNERPFIELQKVKNRL